MGHSLRCIRSREARARQLHAREPVETTTETTGFSRITAGVRPQSSITTIGSKVVTGRSQAAEKRHPEHNTTIR